VRRRIVVLALSVILALVVAMPVASGKPQPTADTGQTIGKKVLGELGAEWWIWALEKPPATNPLVPPYADGCEGPFSLGGREVFFLAGTITGEAVTRECTVPRKTWLFFPVANIFQAERTGVGSEEEFRQFVNNCMDEALVGATMFVTVDGEPLRVSIKKQRADTPFFTFDLPEDNIFGNPDLAGEYQGVADGIWVLLHPLKEGTHTITFGGDFPNNPPGQYPEGCGGPFSQDNTWIITVV
jgi:hypothetical protein